MIVPGFALMAVLALGSADLPPADSLSAAKELYASAAYDDALAMLARLATSAASDEALQIEEYQSLCLYALGRNADAETAVRGLIEREPLFELKGDDVSPRVQAMFADVRKRLLPGIAKEKYTAAKAELEAQQYASAQSHMGEVRQIADEAHRLGVSDSSLDDLGTLADGFRELAGAGIAKAAAAASTAAVGTPPAGAGTTAASAATRPAAGAPTALPSIVEPKGPPAPTISTIYGVSDTDVSPPVAIVQAIPPVPPELIFGVRDRKGLLAVTVAADGHVEDATMRQPFDSPYDQIVLSAAKSWRYKPAIKDGTPVRYVVTISLVYKSPR